MNGRRRGYTILISPTDYQVIYLRVHSISKVISMVVVIVYKENVSCSLHTRMCVCVC